MDLIWYVRRSDLKGVRKLAAPIYVACLHDKEVIKATFESSHSKICILRVDETDVYHACGVVKI